MNVPIRRSPDETRAAILDGAWDLFRQLGARTTIADVAEKLEMSSANIYRFYTSKKELTEAVCLNQLGLLTEGARRAAQSPGTAAERIRSALMTLFHSMHGQMVHEKRAHEIVEVAMAENWPACERFIEDCGAIVAELIAQGQRVGEFGPGNPLSLGVFVMHACVSTHYPDLIAKWAHHPDAMAGAEATIAFALRALSNPKPIDPILEVVPCGPLQP